MNALAHDLSRVIFQPRGIFHLRAFDDCRKVNSIYTRQTLQWHFDLVVCLFVFVCLFGPFEICTLSFRSARMKIFGNDKRNCPCTTITLSTIWRQINVKCATENRRWNVTRSVTPSHKNVRWLIYQTSKIRRWHNQGC